MAQGFKIFVGGLDKSTTDATLHAHFAQYGELTDHVVMKSHGVSRGFGFVSYADENIMQSVVTQRFHNIDGNEAECKSAVPGDKQGGGGGGGGGGGMQQFAPPAITSIGATAQASAVPSNKLFIGGLVKEVTTDDLTAYFGQYGELKDCISMNPRGFGYVEFFLPEPAEQIMANATGHAIHGKQVECRRCVPKDGKGGGKGGGKSRPMPQQQQQMYVPQQQQAYAQPQQQAAGGLDQEAYARAFAAGFAQGKMEAQREAQSAYGRQPMARVQVAGAPYARY